MIISVEQGVGSAQTLVTGGCLEWTRIWNPTSGFRWAPAGAPGVQYETGSYLKAMEGVLRLQMTDISYSEYPPTANLVECLVGAHIRPSMGGSSPCFYLVILWEPPGQVFSHITYNYFVEETGMGCGWSAVSTCHSVLLPPMTCDGSMWHDLHTLMSHLSVASGTGRPTVNVCGMNEWMKKKWREGGRMREGREENYFIWMMSERI